MKLPLSIAATVAAAATRFGLEPLLVAAIVVKESGGDPFAIRYEPAWRYYTTPAGEPCSIEAVKGIDGCSDATERIAQATSWGAMQVMGAVARELGFRGAFLSTLCDPDVGILYGCTHLKGKCRRYTDLEAAVSAYNAGSPTGANLESYVEPVLAIREAFRRDGGF